MSASSAAMSALVVNAFEPGAVLGAAEVEAEVEVEEGVLELLDEQAARSSAAPTAVIPNATRNARGLGLSCLPSGLKRFMRPRIYHTGFDRTSPGARFDLSRQDCQHLPCGDRVSFWSLSPDPHSPSRNVVATTHCHAANRTSIQRTTIFMTLMGTINRRDRDVGRCGPAQPASRDADRRTYCQQVGPNLGWGDVTEPR